MIVYHASKLSWRFERVLWIGLLKGGCGGGAIGGGSGGGGGGDESQLAVLPQERPNTSSILRLIISFAAMADALDLQIRPPSDKSADGKKTSKAAAAGCGGGDGGGGEIAGDGEVKEACCVCVCVCVYVSVFYT